jgi:uncharacterized membrane protein
MAVDHSERVRESDAPLTAAKHQRDIAKDVAEDLSWHEAALVGRTVTINRPREELYAFWRDFRNLAGFMENVDSITLDDNLRSRWVVKAPAGRTVEWTSVVTEDVPNERIAWASEEGADIKFTDGPPGRGTQVTATIVYDPPAGDLGKLIAKLFGKEPKVQARRDLRRFKQLMETGEISTSKAETGAAPRGG